jgi:hypothetical protein
MDKIIFWRPNRQLGSNPWRTKMENKILAFAAVLAALIANIFITGTLIYFAVDVFALYSENQFTGRMRSFDVDYWNAIGGVAMFAVPAKLISLFQKKQNQKMSEEMLDLFDRVIENNSGVLEKLAAEDGGQLPPPKVPKK